MLEKNQQQGDLTVLLREIDDMPGDADHEEEDVLGRK